MQVGNQKLLLSWAKLTATSWVFMCYPLAIIRADKIVKDLTDGSYSGLLCFNTCVAQKKAKY